VSATTPAPAPAAGTRSAARAALAVIALALVLRSGLFPFAENKHGDAPMRALIAEWLNLVPHAAADPRTYCQFGPLHTTLMRPFLALDPVAPRSSRYLSLLAGYQFLLVLVAAAVTYVDAGSSIPEYAPTIASCQPVTPSEWRYDCPAISPA